MHQSLNLVLSHFCKALCMNWIWGKLLLAICSGKKFVNGSQMMLYQFEVRKDFYNICNQGHNLASWQQRAIRKKMTILRKTLFAFLFVVLASLFVDLLLFPYIRYDANYSSSNVHAKHAVPICLKRCSFAAHVVISLRLPPGFKSSR